MGLGGGAKRHCATGLLTSGNRHWTVSGGPAKAGDESSASASPTQRSTADPGAASMCIGIGNPPSGGNSRVTITAGRGGAGSERERQLLRGPTDWPRNVSI